MRFRPRVVPPWSAPICRARRRCSKRCCSPAARTDRRGSVRDGNTVGDHAPEARARQMSTEINVADATFLGDPVDHPRLPRLGRAGLGGASGDARRRRRGRRVRARGRARADAQRRCCIFSTSTTSRTWSSSTSSTRASARVRDVLAALQSVSARPLVLRQVPLRGGEGEITGYVDLVSERAYRYQAGPGLRPDQAARRISGTTSAQPAPASSKSSPISTTSCWSSCSRTCSPRRKKSTST